MQYMSLAAHTEAYLEQEHTKRARGRDGSLSARYEQTNDIMREFQ